MNYFTKWRGEGCCERKYGSKEPKKLCSRVWRFFLCMTFMLIHVFMIYPVMYWNIAPYVTDSGKVLFSGAMDIIIIFYIISGYFLMRSYRKRKLQRKDEKTHSAKEAWGYLSKRLKGLYPAFLIALVFGLVLSNIYRDIPIQDWLFTAIVLSGNFWEQLLQDLELEIMHMAYTQMVCMH